MHHKSGVLYVVLTLLDLPIIFTQLITPSYSQHCLSHFSMYHSLLAFLPFTGLNESSLLAPSSFLPFTRAHVLSTPNLGWPHWSFKYHLCILYADDIPIHISSSDIGHVPNLHSRYSIALLNGQLKLCPVLFLFSVKVPSALLPEVSTPLCLSPHISNLAATPVWNLITSYNHIPETMAWNMIA